MDQVTEQNAQSPLSTQNQTSLSPQIASPAAQNPKTENYFRKIFSGRLNRRNYFIGSLLVVAFGIAANLLWYSFNTTPILIHRTSSLAAAFGLFPVAIIGTFYNISFAIRRHHDLNKTGWLMLLLYIPIVGAFYALYVLFAPGSNGGNKYGGQPLSRIDIKQDIFQL